MMLHRIENKIKSIEETLVLLERLKPECKQKFLEDIKKYLEFIKESLGLGVVTSFS